MSFPGYALQSIKTPLVVEFEDIAADTRTVTLPMSMLRTWFLLLESDVSSDNECPVCEETWPPHFDYCPISGIHLSESTLSTSAAETLGHRLRLFSTPNLADLIVSDSIRPPVYPISAAFDRTEGTVMLFILVNGASGQHRVYLAKSSDDARLDNQAVRYISTMWQFQPASFDYSLTVEVDFFITGENHLTQLHFDDVLWQP